MDPYNPNNNYGYQPPPNSGMPPPGYMPPPMNYMAPPPIPGPYGPGGYNPNLGYAYPPPNFAPSGIPPPFISRPPMPVMQQQPTGPILTLFIGGINKGVTDESMEKILRCVGTLLKWKRLKDPTSNLPKSFGFADFDEPKAVLLLSGLVKDKQIKLPSPAQGVEPKSIMVKYEEDVEKVLEKYKRDNKIKELDDDVINEVHDKVQQVISEMEGYVEPNSKADGEGKEEEKNGKKYISDSEDSDFSEEERQILRYKEQEIQRQRSRSEEYYQNLKHWEERELYRGKSYEKSRIRDRESEERREQDRAEHYLRFKEWDDDKELELGREDYYKDRSRWWERRKQIRQRELEEDAIDRMKEKKEKNPEDTKIEEEEEIKKEEKEEKEEFKAKVKINFINPILKKVQKETSNTGNTSPAISTFSNPMDDDDDTYSNNRTKRVLIPLEYSDEEDHNKKSRRERLSERQKKEEIKKLMNRIPPDHVKLWEWKIRWKYLSEGALTKIMNFADKKIIEFLGEEEKSISSFIKRHLKNHLSAEELKLELEKVLEEEAITFVSKIWRMLIFETEARYLNLL
ncbi:hypothetical protein K502DRAFT_345123 [Neoconidiobolus thromboides FSU 785]|nr:hypothetical protein K502DRAFT_345123 [Neoconidiobolus thromboides FSU 785]